MERNPTLIKDILEYVEQNTPSPRGFLFLPALEEYPSEDVEEHVRVCGMFGYVLLNRTGHIKELTKAGYLELDRLRIPPEPSEALIWGPDGLPATQE